MAEAAMHGSMASLAKTKIPAATSSSVLLLGVAQHHDFARLDALRKFKASGMFCEQVNVFHFSASAHDVIDTGDGSNTILCKWNINRHTRFLLT